MAKHLKASLVCDALKMTKAHRGCLKGCLHHSNQGKQYASSSFQALLKRYGMEGSMSRKGNCWDHGVCESFFHSLKVECLGKKPLKTRAQAQLVLFAYIETFYNPKRLHSFLGYQLPKAFERATHVV